MRNSLRRNPLAVWLDSKIQAEVERQIELSLDGQMEIVQRRIKQSLSYWLEKQVQGPEIVIRDEIVPHIGTEYCLASLDVQPGEAFLFGGNFNLVKLELGDIIEIRTVYLDHRGNKGQFAGESISGPLPNPFYILETQVVTSGIQIYLRQPQGHSRPVSYCFYKWR